MQANLRVLSAALPDTGENPENLGARLGETVTLCGTIHKIRRMSGFAFVLVRAARQVIQCIYDPAQADFDLETLQEEAAVRLIAEVVADPRSRQGWELRLRACRILSFPASEPPARPWTQAWTPC
ncbi:MAG TPA: OB-fold nucleic acid binding domain-containing protein [Clostridia bacterium]|nr:OB-fold nucleic acid binding domain-containing protein [Clostridia bacterium]